MDRSPSHRAPNYLDHVTCFLEFQTVSNARSRGIPRNAACLPLFTVAVRLKVERFMRFAVLALFFATLGVVGFGGGAGVNQCEACIWPRVPTDPLPPLNPPPPPVPCIRITKRGIALQTNVFVTTTTNSCACAISITNPSLSLNFSEARIGVIDFNDLDSFTPILTTTGAPFSLLRNPSADSSWDDGTSSNGLDSYGAQSLPGGTWMAFSNPSVGPVTPPVLGANQAFAIEFLIDNGTPFDVTTLLGSKIQYGAGMGDGSGLPEFNATHHAALYSGVNDIGQFKVDGNGDSYYTTCPEPATYVTALLAVGLFTVRGSLRHLTRKNT